MKNKKIILQDWGLIDYKEAWDKQEALLASTVKLKALLREKNAIPAGDLEEEAVTPNYLIFCQHPHVYTLGNSGKPQHLLLDTDGLKEKNAVYYAINRGGDITYHGPGQLVCYPIFDLDNFFTDIHLYLRTLEEAVILTLAGYGLKAGRYPGYTGVWFDADNGPARKICAMGVRCSRWVTMHGLALNVNTHMDYFKNMIPCGIENKAVTSMQQELGAAIDIKEVQKVLQHHISVLFNIEKEL